MPRAKKRDNPEDDYEEKESATTKKQRASDASRTTGRASATGDRRPASTTGSVDDGQMMASAQKPFKSKEWVKKRDQQKRNRWTFKTLKQILALENYDQLPASVPTYVNIEAPPSAYPPKKYCDLTGLPVRMRTPAAAARAAGPTSGQARYTDPKTKLRYHSAAEFATIRSLPEWIVQGYLEMRKAGGVLK